MANKRNAGKRTRTLFICFLMTVLTLSVATCGFYSMPNVSREKEVSDIAYAATSTTLGVSTFQLPLLSGGQMQAVYFGSEGEDKLIWRILSNNDTKYGSGNELLLYSDQFMRNTSVATWQKSKILYHESPMREYLNGNFYSTHFDENEKKYTVGVQQIVTAHNLGIPLTPSANNTVFTDQMYYEQQNKGVVFLNSDMTEVSKGELPQEKVVIEKSCAGDKLFIPSYFDFTKEAGYNFTDSYYGIYPAVSDKYDAANKIIYQGSSPPGMKHAYAVKGLTAPASDTYCVTRSQFLYRNSYKDAAYIQYHSSGGMYIRYTYVDKDYRPMMLLQRDSILYATAANIPSGGTNFASVSVKKSVAGRIADGTQNTPVYKLYLKKTGEGNYIDYNNIDENVPIIEKNASEISVKKSGETGDVVFLISGGTGSVTHQAHATFDSNGKATATIPTGMDFSDKTVSVLFIDGTLKGGNQPEIVKASYNIPLQIPSDFSAEYDGTDTIFEKALEKALEKEGLFDSLLCNNVCTISYPDGKPKTPGSYTVKFNLTSNAISKGLKWDDIGNTTDEKTVTFTITKKPITIKINQASNFDIPTAEIDPPNQIVEGDSPPTIVFRYTNETGTPEYNDIIPPSTMGEYKATAEISGESNYIIDKTKPHSCIYEKDNTVAKPTIAPENQSKEFTGNEIKFPIDNVIIGTVDNPAPYGATLNPDSAGEPLLPRIEAIDSKLYFIARNVGEYKITYTLSKSDLVWKEGGNAPVTLTVNITKKKIPKPTIADISREYSGSDINFAITGYDETFIKYEVGASDPPGKTCKVENGSGGWNFVAKDCATYAVTFKLKEKPNTEWSTGGVEDFTLNPKITQKELGIPHIDNKTQEFDGTEKTFPISDYEANGHVQATVTSGAGGQVSGTDFTATNVGTYTITFHINDVNYKWSNGTTGDVVIDNVKITVLSVDKPKMTGTLTATYSGQPLSFGITGYNSTRVRNNATEIGGSIVDPFTAFTAENAGTYNIEFKLKDSTNTQWTGGGTDSVKYTVTINPQEVAVPTFSSGAGSEVYSGGDITFELQFNENVVNAQTTNGGNLSGKTFSAKDVNDYVINFTLNNTNNYKWQTVGGTDTKTLTAHITKAQLTISFEAVGGWEWTIGTAKEISFTVTGIKGSDNVTFDTKCALGAINKSLTFSKSGNKYTATVPGDPNTFGKGEYTLTVALQSGGVNANYEIQGAAQQTFNISLKHSTFENVQWQYTHNDITQSATEGMHVTYDGAFYKVSIDETHLTDKGVKIKNGYQNNNGTNANPYATAVTIVALDDTWDYVEKTFTLNWTIDKKTITKPTVSGETAFSYDGGAKSITLNGFDGATMTKSGTESASGVGEYTIKISLQDINNTCWSDTNVSNPFDIKWKIIKAVITVSWQDKPYPDSGPEKFRVPHITSNEDKIEYKYYKSNEGGDQLAETTLDQIVVGVTKDYYLVTATIKSEFFTNYEFEGESKQSVKKTFYVGVNKTAVTITITGSGQVYDGQAKEATLQITTGGLNAADFIVKYKNKTSGISVEKPINAGSYTVNVSLTDAKYADYYISGDNEFDFEITKAKIDMAGVKWDYTAPFVYDRTGGTEKEYTVQLSGLPELSGGTINYKNNKSKVAGTLVASFEIKGVDGNHEVVNNNAGTLSWTIEKKKFDKPKYTGGELVYNNTNRDLSAMVGLPEGYGDYMTLSLKKGGEVISGTSVKDAGVYVLTVDFIGAIKNNVEWNEGGNEKVEITITISKIKVTVPTENAIGITFDNTEKTYMPTDFDDAKMNITGNRQTNAGDNYEAVISLKDKVNYCWDRSGNDTNDVTIIWKIGKLEFAKPTGKVGDIFYNAEEQTYSIDGLNETYMTVSGNKGTNAKDDYKAVIHLTDQNNTCWQDDKTATDVTLTWSIKKKVLQENWNAAIPPEITDAVEKGVSILTYAFTNNESLPVLPENFVDGTTYTAKATIKDEYATNYTFANGTATSDGHQFMTRELEKIDIPAFENSSLTYTGNELTFVLVGDLSKIDVAGGLAYTEAGDYEITLTIKADYCDTHKWRDNTTGAKTLKFSIAKMKIDKPTASEQSFTYNGSPQTYNPAGFDGTHMTISGNEQTNANSGYTVTVSLLDKVNTCWADDESADDVMFTWVIAKLKIDKPTEDLTEFKYTGSPQTYNPAGFDGTRMTISGNEQTNANSGYTVTVSLLDKVNTCWNDESADDVTFNWVIGKKKFEKPTGDGEELVYDTTEQSFRITGVSDEYMTVSGDVKATNAGDAYKAVVSLKDADNTCWADDSVTDVELVWKIAKQTIAEEWNTEIPPVLNGAYDSMLDYTYTDGDGLTVAPTRFQDGVMYYAQAKIKSEFTGNYGFGASGNAESTKHDFTTKPLTPMDIPTVEGTFTYNGQEQTFVLVGNDLDKIEVVGQLTYKNAGEYSVIVKIKPEFASEYKWNDNTTGEKTIQLKIEKLAVNKPTENNGEFIYNGKEQEFALDGFDGKYMKVTGNKQTNAKDGYKVTVSLLDKVNTCWTDDEEGKDVTFDFVIEKLVLPAPTASEQSFTYNGKVQEYMPEGFDKEYMKITGNKQTNAGVYTVTASLKNKNVGWEDADVTEYTFSFEIERLTITPKWENDENGIPKLVNPDIPESEIEYIFKNKNSKEITMDELLLDEQYTVQASFKNGNINNCVFTDTGKLITNKHVFKFNGGLEPSTSNGTSGDDNWGKRNWWWVLIICGGLVALIVYFSIKSNYYSKRAENEDDAKENNNYKTYGTVIPALLATSAFLGLSIKTWIIIIGLLCGIAVIAAFVLMYKVHKYKLSKEERVRAERENAAESKKNEAMKEQRREEMQFMMTMMGCGIRPNNFQNQPQYQQTDIPYIVSEVVNKLTPTVQECLPPAEADETSKKMLDKQQQIIADLIAQMNSNSGKNSEADETLKQVLAQQERLINAIADKSINGNAEQQNARYDDGEIKSLFARQEKMIEELREQVSAPKDNGLKKMFEEQSEKLAEQAEMIKKLQNIVAANIEANAKAIQSIPQNKEDGENKNVNAVKMAKIALLIDDAIAKNASKQTYMEMANMLIEAATNAKGDLDKVQLNSCVNKLIERIKSTK